MSKNIFGEDVFGFGGGGPGGAANPFDQDLNTTNSPVFALVTATSGVRVPATAEIRVGDIGALSARSLVVPLTGASYHTLNGVGGDAQVWFSDNSSLKYKAGYDRASGNYKIETGAAPGQTLLEIPPTGRATLPNGLKINNYNMPNTVGNTGDVMVLSNTSLFFQKPIGSVRFAQRRFAINSGTTVETSLISDTDLLGSRELSLFDFVEGNLIRFHSSGTVTQGAPVGNTLTLRWKLGTQTLAECSKSFGNVSTTAVRTSIDSVVSLVDEDSSIVRFITNGVTSWGGESLTFGTESIIAFVGATPLQVDFTAQWSTNDAADNVEGTMSYLTIS